ncbi:MAG: helix-turn-helix domain-containing protein [Gammaproteobacteria bacterium]|nr:helix-turn-helix domain-containing protein [Gammaproteobacteria bacterium]
MDTHKRWQAIINRTLSDSELFFYGVLTTGVFCRPDCSSKLPKQDNVVFFNSIDEAKQAGYRACKRCHPESTTQNEKRIAQIISACRIIDQSEEKQTLEVLAKAVGLSTYHFQREFKKYVGISPLQYGRGVRTARFERLLTEHESITDAIFASGYQSTTSAYQDNSLAMSPKVYRAGGKGVNIQFSIKSSKFGYVVIGVTKRGICAIHFADSPTLAEITLRERFPQADIQEADNDLQALIGATVAYIENPDSQCELPLDIQGTAFQQ